MNKFLKDAFVWKKEYGLEQLCIKDAILFPFSNTSAFAERTVSKKMRSEYASTDVESGEVASTKADKLSAIEATSKAQNVENHILLISADDDAFSLDESQIELISGLRVCEDCTNCDDFKKCHERNDK